MLSTIVPFEQVEVGQSFHLIDHNREPMTYYTYTRIDSSPDPIDDNCLIMWDGGEATTLLFNEDMVSIIMDTDTPNSPDYYDQEYL